MERETPYRAGPPPIPRELGKRLQSFRGTDTWFIYLFFGVAMTTLGVLFAIYFHSTGDRYDDDGGGLDLGGIVAALMFGAIGLFLLVRGTGLLRTGVRIHEHGLWLGAGKLCFWDQVDWVDRMKSRLYLRDGRYWRFPYELRNLEALYDEIYRRKAASPRSEPAPFRL